MYRIGNILLFIATILILFVGGGIIVDVIPTGSPIIASLTVISLFFSTIGMSLKKKYKRER